MAYSNPIAIDPWAGILPIYGHNQLIIIRLYDACGRSNERPYLLSVVRVCDDCAVGGHCKSDTLPNRTEPPIHCSGRALCRPTRNVHSTTCKRILTNTDVQGCWPAQGSATTTADYRKKNDYMEQKSQILTCPSCCQHVGKCGMIIQIAILRLPADGAS